MVKILESQRPRRGAGRRKRPLHQNKSFVYYTATDGQTILEDDSQIAASQVQNVANDESPSSVEASSTVAVTPSSRKRNRDLRMDALDERCGPPATSDAAVQVIDEEDHKLNEATNGIAPLQEIKHVVNDSNAMSFQEEKIEQLTVQLQEKDKIIAELLRSKEMSFSPATMMRTQNLNSKTIQSMQFHLEEMKQTHSDEVAHLKLDITKWKRKATDLLLEIERMKKNNSSNVRTVYNSRFLLDDRAALDSTDGGKQSEQQQPLTFIQNDNNSAEVVREEPEPTKRRSSSLLYQQQQIGVSFDSSSEMRALLGNNCNNNASGNCRPKRPIVSPRAIKNITYLGVPLSLQRHLDTNSEFRLMVMAPCDDSDDEGRIPV